MTPGVLLPMALMAGGAFMTYRHDLAATAKSIAGLSGNLDNVSAWLDRDEQDTAARVRDLVPVIRASELQQKQSDIIGRQQNDGIEAIAQSILQMRQSIETLRDAVQQTHEELKIEQATRKQHEGRLMPRDGRALTLDEAGPVGH